MRNQLANMPRYLFTMLQAVALLLLGACGGSTNDNTGAGTGGQDAGNTGGATTTGGAAATGGTATAGGAGGTGGAGGAGAMGGTAGPGGAGGNGMVADDFGIGFLCETPVDLLVPEGDDYVVIKARGVMNDCEDPLKPHEPALGTLEEYVDGVLWPMDYGTPVIGRHSGMLFVGSQNYLHVSFFGTPQAVAPNHTVAHIGVVYVNFDGLPSLLSEDRNYLELGLEFAYYHTRTEQILDNGNNHTKECDSYQHTFDPVAKLFACHEGVLDYSIGDTLSLVGIFYTKALAEGPANCQCYLNSVSQSSCDAFDALAGTP